MTFVNFLTIFSVYYAWFYPCHKMIFRHNLLYALILRTSIVVSVVHRLAAGILYIFKYYSY